MAHINWTIKGPEYGNCNCAWGCPCQFNALPTDGTCKAVVGMRIDEGIFGDTKLDGLCWAGSFQWPGPVHEGNGACQFFIDERADEAQRHAIGEIINGRETDEMATHFAVYASTMTTVHETKYVPIEFEANIEECTAKFRVAGELESVGGPIISPFSGEPHRVKVSLRTGFEYAEAEYGSGTGKSTGAIKLEFKDSYGQFAYLHLNQNGVVR
ncbi:MAG: DUF1326 domain-containing protein [SAR324 cluster bacterium]|nr:DUF1326 domain-containing protein [SAR324 cluster bacterium]